MTREEALEKIQNVHGNKYKLENGWEYVNANTDITLFCPKHGKFHKTFYLLVNKEQGCPTCSHNGKVYKESGYWNIKENCIEEAKKYHNKWELQKKCVGCYNGLRRNNWLDEVATKFFDDSIQYMQYNDKINVVYVYEFSQYNTCYVGRSNNIKRRDRQHRNGYGHKNGSRTFDSVYQFAKSKSIEIPKPKLLEENLTAYESQELEDKWKREYINNGWSILNKGATGIGKGSLGASLKWTYEACLEESKKYKSKNEMKAKNQSAYNSARKNGWINNFFQNKKKGNDIPVGSNVPS